MLLVRVMLGAVGFVLGAYTIYAVVLAVRAGTNLGWVAFVGSLMAALGVLLVRAALAHPAERVSARFLVPSIAAAMVYGGLRGYEASRGLAGAVIGLILGALIGSVFVAAVKSRPRSDSSPASGAGTEE